MPLLVEISSSSNHWAGTYGPLLALFWLREVDPLICRQLEKALPRLAARQPEQRMSVVSVAMPGASNPGNEARVAIASLLRETAETVSRVAVVREGNGFVTSVVSSVIIGIQMLARPRCGHRPFSSLEEAVPWVTAELPDFVMDSKLTDDTLAVLVQQRRALLARPIGRSGPSMRSAAGG